MGEIKSAGVQHWYSTGSVEPSSFDSLEHGDNVLQHEEL